MKTLQNNFTTPEQSKRLYELGVPEWTADCCFSKSKDSDFICEGVRHVIPDDFCVQSVPFPAYPCWSVGRLREIFYYSADDKEHVKEVLHELPNCSIETLINIITVFVKQYNELDFSKLED